MFCPRTLVTTTQSNDLEMGEGLLAGCESTKIHAHRKPSCNIEGFHNTRRRSTNGMLSPVDYERRNTPSRPLRSRKPRPVYETGATPQPPLGNRTTSGIGGSSLTSTVQG